MPTRILILCDEPDLDSLIRDTLESWGQERGVREIMTVTCIEDAWHAVTRRSGAPFAPVITRLDMPRVKNESVTLGQRLGVEFLRNAKHLGGFANCIMGQWGYRGPRSKAPIETSCLMPYWKVPTPTLFQHEAATSVLICASL